MSTEFAIFAVVLGNMLSAVLGFMAGRSFGPAVAEVALGPALNDAAKTAAENHERAKKRSEEKKRAVEIAAGSDSPESGIAEIFNADRGVNS